MTDVTSPTEPQVTIEQGPAWLVDFYLSPPSWVNSSIKIIGLVAVAIVIYRLHQRRWRVDLETQLAMGKIAGTVTGVLIGTLTMANLTNQPYLVDVGIGFLAGYGAAMTATSRLFRKRMESYVPDPQARAAGAWLVLVALTLLGPGLVNVHGRGMHLFGAQMAIELVGVGMIILNIAENERSN